MISLLRPWHWTKNLFVFAALIFSRQFTAPDNILKAAVVFAAFCLLSSGIYALNDVIDKDRDRVHPWKRRRPVASGRISCTAAVVAGVLLLSAGILVGRYAVLPAQVCLAGYVVLQICYIFILRNIVIVDVLAVSAGFVLRAAAGAYAIGVVISPWLIACTALLALLIILGKRKHEFGLGRNPSRYRAVLGLYTGQFLDQMISITAGATVIAYLLYSFSERTIMEFPSGLIPLTVPFVFYCIVRFLYLLQRGDDGVEPELMIFRDYPLLTGVLLWLATAIFTVSI